MEYLLILVGLILLLVLVNIVTLNVRVDGLKHNNTNPQINNDIKQTPEFKEGLNNGFSLVQIALFKMWKEHEILDFDNLNLDIKNNLTEITADMNKMIKWQTEFLEYLKGKEDASGT